MDFKHIKMQQDGNAEIFLYDAIGKSNVTSSSVADEVQFLTTFGGVTNILVHINSEGGDMIQGFGIFSALQNAINNGIEVDTINDGVAASMAGPILFVGKKRKMVDFGLIMLHDPSMPHGNADEKTKEILSKFKDSAITMMSGRTGISPEDIQDMMSAETWLNAEEALAMGMITEIVKTKTNATNNISLLKNMNQIGSIMFNESRYSPVMHSFKSINKIKSKNMNKVAMTFGLSGEASEESINTAAQDSVAKNVSLQAEVDTLKADVLNKDTEIKDLGKKVEATNKANAIVMIENAVKEGKIKEENKESMTVQAIANPTMVAELLGGIEAIVAPKEGNLLQALLSADKGGNTTIPKMGYREMERKEPETLAEIKANNSELHAEMYKKEYNVEFSN